MESLVISRQVNNDESVFKVMYLAIRQSADKWKTIHHWKPALQVFQIVFGEDKISLNEN